MARRWLLTNSLLKSRGKKHNLETRARVAHYRQVVKAMHDHGLAVNGFFFNTPSDSRDTFAAMSDFLTRSNIDLVTHAILTPLPGTRLFDSYLPKLCWRDFPRDWRRFDFSQLVLEPTRMSMAEFYRLRHEMVLSTHSARRVMRVTANAITHSQSLLLGLLVLIGHLAQRRSHARELARNLAELAKLGKARARRAAAAIAWPGDSLALDPLQNRKTPPPSWPRGSMLYRPWPGYVFGMQGIEIES